MTAPGEPVSPDRYPYKTPRWILWVVGAVSVAAVIAAFIVGPTDEPKQRASRTTLAPSTEVNTTAGSTTTAPPTTAGPTTTRPTTSAPSTSTAPPTAPAPTTAPPTTAPPTAPPTTAPPTTAPPRAAPATVALTSCRVEAGRTIIATGTLTNPGDQGRRFRASAVVTDRAGNAVTGLSVDLSAGPGATVPWTISQEVDGPTASQVTSCRAGGVTAL